MRSVSVIDAVAAPSADVDATTARPRGENADSPINLLAPNAMAGDKFQLA